MKRINYSNSIVGIPNSILKYFGIGYFNSTSKVLDKYLNKYNPQNIIIILCDGMGFNFLKNNLSKKDFLLKNTKKVISSVFPTTTTAATTSIITGLTPNQHCWLGWDNYIKPINKVVTLYLNKEKDTDNTFDENIGFKFFPYKTIFDIINQKTNTKATYLSPFTGTYYKDIDDMFNQIILLTQKHSHNFIYAYYDNPDAIMHKYGVNSIESINQLHLLNIKIEELTKKINNSIVIVTADHGLIDSSNIYLEDYEEIFDCLLHTTSIDSRASMMFVKHEKKALFEKLFQNYFKKDFVLLSKEEIIQSSIFGIGKGHKLFKSCLGDYIAIAIKNKNIKYKRNGKELLANHAGLTKEEIYVPLIIKNIK